MLSAAAIASYGAWLVLPESTSVQVIYDRFIAREEARPRVFEEGITVRLNREAPPVAALEEALREQPWASAESDPASSVHYMYVRGIELKAGDSSGGAVEPVKMAQRILAENDSFRRQNAPTLAPVSAPILPSLAPEHHIQRRMQMSAEGPSVRRGVSLSAVTPRSSNTNVRSVEELQIAESQSASSELAAAASAPAKTVERTISASQLGMTREQVLAALLVPMSGGPIFKPSPKREVAAAAKSDVKPNTSLNADPSREIAERALGAMAPVNRQVTIRGLIELSGGLALTHAQDHIVVLRESRGQFIESGAVWLRDARYEIFVESMEGHLIAEVRSPQGEVIGRGQADLGTLVGSIKGGNQKSIDGVTLRVTPISTGIGGRVQSGYTAGATTASGVYRATRSGVSGARVEFQQTPSSVKSVAGGYFEDVKFTEGSRVLARVAAPPGEAKDQVHLPTLAMMTSGQEAIVPVFTKKMMTALVNLTMPDATSVEDVMERTGI
ncbi:MAG: hypothetical protein RBT63_09220, partial [Bdellovibrionales bacterium]|nr:hypothetical protein [Bdellovibrionales bacterium]